MAYADLIIWQYRGQPRARAHAQLIDSMVAPTWSGFQAMLGTYDIDRAVGISLDVIGRIVGVSRILAGALPRKFFGFEDNPYAGPFQHGQTPGGVWYRYGAALSDSASASDDEMRTLIRLKVIKNYQTGTLPNLMQALTVLLGGPFANANDNYDMTVTIYAISSRVTPFVRFVLERMDILPRPVGVRLILNTDFDFDPTVFTTIHRIVNVTMPQALQRIQDFANANSTG
ncbi:DUF2612 domain-containing protein [Paraburkholderia sp. BR10923]|uniref:DUF2612 domain-containing protein n=1 Tax=Paraburkholderia sp. BR10923 TaxID=3236992 RepID=UPI0034CD6607